LATRNQRQGTGAIAYALRLQQADVAVELHVVPGVPHGFDAMGKSAMPSMRATQLIHNALADAFASSPLAERSLDY
jgi:acetyl esterase/lipase